MRHVSIRDRAKTEDNEALRIFSQVRAQAVVIARCWPRLTGLSSEDSPYDCCVIKRICRATMDDSGSNCDDSYASSSHASEASFSEADYSSLNEAEPSRRKARLPASKAKLYVSL